MATASNSTEISCKTTNDSPLLAAYSVYRAYHTSTNDGFDTALRDAEEALLNVPATTIQGIEAKLRVIVDLRRPGKWPSEEALKPLGTPMHEREVFESFDERLLFVLAKDVSVLTGGRAA